MTLDGRKKKLRTVEELSQASCEVFCRAQQENVKVALLGGYALHLHGSPRLTGDVDFVSDGTIESLPTIGQLSFGGVKTETSAGVAVDLIIRTDDYRLLYETALADAVRRTATATLPVVRPEFLAAMKMAAGRRSDTADLEFLIKEEIIDLPETRAIIHRFLGPYAATEFDQSVMIAKWQKSKE